MATTSGPPGEMSSSSSRNPDSSRSLGTMSCSSTLANSGAAFVLSVRWTMRVNMLQSVGVGGKVSHGTRACESRAHGRALVCSLQGPRAGHRDVARSWRMGLVGTGELRRGVRCSTVPDHEETETRHVSLEEIRAGIKLHAGHPVVLIVSDASKIGTSEIDASGETGPATPSLLGSLEAAHFETAKAFPLEGALPSFRAIAALLTAEPKRTPLIVGHRGTVGKAEDNLKLPGERAAAVSAYLRSDVDEGRPVYAHPEAQEKRGVREDPHT